MAEKKLKIVKQDGLDITFDGEWGGSGPSTAYLTGATQTSTSTESGGDNVVTFYKSDGSTSTLTVKNGAQGASGITPTITAAAGANIGTVGTPSVTASTAGTTTTFTFNNLKGATGASGITPTITAAAGANIGTVGTPSVTASTAGTTTTFTFNNLKGATGASGTSVTITSKSVTYQASSNGTTAPTGTWSTSVPTVTKGQFLWSKTVVTYSTGDSTTTYNVGYQGTNGTNATTTSVVSTTANGLAPKVTDTSKFLKGDGTWATPTGFAVSQSLATNANLNSITTPGFYNASGGNSITNTPIAGDAFGLIVTHNASGSYYSQYYEDYTGKRYWRTCNNGTWSAWTSEVTQTTLTGYLPLSGGTMTGQIVMPVATSGTDIKGIKFGSAGYISSLTNRILMIGTDALRFSDVSTWNSDVWGGMKYNSTNKVVSLGIADGSVFSANTAQTGGKLTTPGCDTITIGNGNANTGVNMKYDSTNKCLDFTFN